MRGRSVALTFDAESGANRPTHSVRERGWAAILDTLSQAGVPATFFLQVDWACQHPGLARRTAAEGHLIGNHTLNHLPLGDQPEHLTDQIETAAAIIRDLLPGVDSHPWFRLPYFNGRRSTPVRQAIAALGWEHIGCNCDASDWDPATSTPDKAVANVLADYANLGPGPEVPAVVMFHTWPHPTPAAVAALISTLREEGAVFVRIDELAEEQRAQVY